MVDCTDRDVRVGALFLHVSPDGDEIFSAVTVKVHVAHRFPVQVENQNFYPNRG